MAGGDIEAKIGGDASGVVSAFKQAGAGATAFGLSLKAIGGFAVAATGVLASFFAVFKAIGFVVNSTKTFIDFEEQLIRTSATLGNFVGETREINGEMVTFEQATADLSTAIRSVASESSFTASQVGEMAEVLALAGLSSEEMADKFDEAGNRIQDGAIRSMVNFAVVAGTDVETAAGIGIAAVKAFRRETEELDEVTSVLTNTFTSSFVNLQQLGDAMRFFGPTASAAGVSIEEAAAAIGALGNSGLQGSIAGTGLRQAINKLIAPTDDARRTMERLGLELTTLTPAGQAAQVGLNATMSAMSGLEEKIASTNRELRALTNEMNDLSIQEEKNSLDIAKIRARAARQGRDLTKAELSQIQRLESANSDLSLQRRELALQAREEERANEQNTHSLEEQKSKFDELKTTVESQTTGVISLVDILDRLNETGATTAEILEIFGVRGGGAVLALQAQTEAFRELATANEEVAMAAAEGDSMTKKFVGTLETSTAFALKETQSKFEELALVVGEPFATLLSQEDGVLDMFNSVADNLAENRQLFEDIALQVEESLLPALAEALKPENIDKFEEGLRAVIPVIEEIGIVLHKLAQIIEPILDGILKVTDFLGMTGDETTTGGAMRGNQFGEDRLVGNQGESRFNSAMDIGKTAAAGAAIGSVVPGVGTLIGGAIGAGVGLTIEVGQAFFGDPENAAAANATGGLAGGHHSAGGPMGMPMATGGLVTGPTRALIGEAGPEAVIPLDRLDRMMGGSSGNSTEQVINLNFDSINIGAGNAVTATEVRDIMEAQMPSIIRNSLTRGARGVI